MSAPGTLPPLPPSDTCVKCGLCLPHCPTYRLTGNEAYSPRGRLAAMSAALHDDASVDAAYDDALSTCLGCRACEAVCPGLVPYGLAFETAKADLVVRRPSPARSTRRVLLGRAVTNPWLVHRLTRAATGAQRLGADRMLPAFARRGMAGLRQLDRDRRSWRGRSATARPPRRGTVALLAGCVMDEWFGPVHDATVAVATRAGYDVVVPAGQVCCGALAAHDGHAAEARKLAAANAQAFASFETLISDAAGCTAHLKEYDHWLDGSGMRPNVVDATEFVAGLITDGSLPSFEPDRGPVAVQDPCHLRHAQRITDEPRIILRAAGYTPVEIDDRGLCCGAAGIYSVLHPATSSELGSQKAAQVVASGAPVVASANPGCEMQLRAHLGQNVRVAHPVELYWRTFSKAE